MFDKAPCAMCDGIGMVGFFTCMSCHGTGWVMTLGPARKCATCDGRGTIGFFSCTVCHGTGWV